MLHRLKQALARRLPVTGGRLSAETERLNTEIQTLQKAQQESLKQITALNRALKESNTLIRRMQEQTGRTLERMEKSGRLCQLMASEGVWAEVFNNTITGSSWLKDQTFSPGRWALGYQALYVLYRTLDQVRPSSILELGLGQSTHMTTQYAQQQKDVSHLVVENDPNWIAFYERRNPLGDNTHILQMDLTFQPYRDAPAVRSYANFQQLKGKTFDLILIDAPLGGDMKQFARVDLLGLLPDCLAPSFVILMDDTNRPGEKHTVAEITEVLQPLGAVTATYSGAKDMTIWTSPDLSFLCTM